MVDPENPLGPVDAAYAQAEAVLADDHARAARRARVLAQIAQDVAAQPVAAPASTRRPPWRNGGWLAAASVVGLSVFVATRLQPPSPPHAPAAGAAATARVTETDAAPRLQSAATAQPGAALKDREVAADVAAKNAPPPPTFVAAPPPAPTQKEIAANDAASVGVDAARDESLGARQPAPANADRTETFGYVAPPAATSGGFAAQQRAAPRGVSNSAAKAATDPARRLRAAAAAGRTAEVEDLLAQGVVIDAPDADGDTALMKSVLAGRVKTAALLRRHGAGLDRKNRAGVSVRDVAAARRDADLDAAIGVEP